MAVSNNGVPQSPLVITDNLVGSRIFVGITTPSNPVNGDIWIDSNPLNNAGKNLTSTVTLGGGLTNLSVPSNYKDVCVVIRGLAVTSTSTLSILLNSDSASNYSGQLIGGSTISTALFQVPLTANVSTNGLILTMQDTQDTLSWQLAKLEGNNGSIISSNALYKTSVAISSINLSVSAGTMGGTALVYGVN